MYALSIWLYVCNISMQIDTLANTKCTFHPKIVMFDQKSTIWLLTMNKVGFWRVHSTVYYVLDISIVSSAWCITQKWTTNCRSDSSYKERKQRHEVRHLKWKWTPIYHEFRNLPDLHDHYLMKWLIHTLSAGLPAVVILTNKKLL